MDELDELQKDLFAALKVAGIDLETNTKAQLELAFHIGRAYGLGLGKGRENVYKELLEQLREKE